MFKDKISIKRLLTKQFLEVFAKSLHIVFAYIIYNIHMSIFVSIYYIIAQ